VEANRPEYQWILQRLTDVTDNQPVKIVAKSPEARLAQWKQTVILFLLGAASATVAFIGAERFGFHPWPYLLPCILVSDALGICLALWQIKRIKKSSN
jgi:hypothetical protein